VPSGSLCTEDPFKIHAARDNLAHGVTGEQFAEPFDALVPLGRYYTQHRTLPTPPSTDAPDAATDDQDGRADGYGQPRGALAGRSSNKHTLARREGFEPTTF
jgi:hypothetical protein